MLTFAFRLANLCWFGEGILIGVVSWLLVTVLAALCGCAGVGVCLFLSVAILALVIPLLIDGLNCPGAGRYSGLVEAISIFTTAPPIVFAVVMWISFFYHSGALGKLFLTIGGILS